jgi:hypothetical protein
VKPCHPRSGKFGKGLSAGFAFVALCAFVFAVSDVFTRTTVRTLSHLIVQQMPALLLGLSTIIFFRRNFIDELTYLLPVGFRQFGDFRKYFL